MIILPLLTFYSTHRLTAVTRARCNTPPAEGVAAPRSGTNIEKFPLLCVHESLSVSLIFVIPKKKDHD